MTTITLNGFIARETEKAVAFLATAATAKPLWIPRAKIAAIVEADALSASVQLAGEGIARLAVPVSVEIDAAFAAKVGAA
jgi:hypothetical protein